MQENIIKILKPNENEIGMRLDSFLVARLNCSRNKIEKMLQKKSIKLNNTPPKKCGILLKSDDEIQILTDISNPPLNTHNLEIPTSHSPLEIPILYEDEEILVLNKPINLLTHRTHDKDLQYTLVDYLKNHRYPLSNLGDSYRQGIIHRLDKTTSGAIVIAKNNQAHAILSEQIKVKTMGRYYLCVITPPLKENIILDYPIIRHPKNRLKYLTSQIENAKNAKSAFVKIAKEGEIELIGAKLFSGRTHQIRVHLAHLNRHIIGDFFYGYKGKYIKRILLHSHLLYLTHPKTHKAIQIYAPLDSLMQDFIKQNFKNTSWLIPPLFFDKTQDFKIPLDEIFTQTFLSCHCESS